MFIFCLYSIVCPPSHTSNLTDDISLKRFLPYCYYRVLVRLFSLRIWVCGVLFTCIVSWLYLFSECWHPRCHCLIKKSLIWQVSLKFGRTVTQEGVIQTWWLNSLHFYFCFAVCSFCSPHCCRHTHTKTNTHMTMLLSALCIFSRSTQNLPTYLTKV